MILRHCIGGKVLRSLALHQRQVRSSSGDFKLVVKVIPTSMRREAVYGIYPNLPILPLPNVYYTWIRKIIFPYPGSPISYSRLVVKVSVGKVPRIHQKFQPINKGGIVWKNLFLPYYHRPVKVMPLNPEDVCTFLQLNKCAPIYL